MNREFLHEFISAILVAVRVCFRGRSDLALAILAPRQQVAVLKRKRPRPKMNSFDLLLWITLRRVGGRWAEVLLIVKPETVVGWHRAGSRLYWRWRFRRRGGRPRTTAEIRTLILRMVARSRHSLTKELRPIILKR
jgi:putative transposase